MPATKKSDPVEVQPKATPVEPGDPEEADAVTQQGSTFAERAKAREAAEKRISGASAENKAVKPSESKTK